MQLGFWALKSEVGKSMTTLWLELHWVNAFIVKKTPEAKSISRSRSFNKNKTNNKEFLLTKLLGHFETVYTRITEKSVEISEVSIMLRHIDKNTSRLWHIFAEHTNDRKKILLQVQQLFEQAYSSDQIYRSTGIVFHWLRSYLPRQMSLFEQEFQKKDSSYELSRTINRINSKYGWLKVNFWKDLIGAKKSEKLFIRQ
jgi:nucleotidyltransferase/DNA polymerase involved in DNA repair